MKKTYNMVRTLNKVTVTLFLLLIVNSCAKKAKQTAVFDDTQIESGVSTKAEQSIVLGEWRLDSVVFTNDSLRNSPQISFSPVFWSFTENGEYIIRIQQNSLDVLMDGDSAREEKSLKAEIPAQEHKGKYSYSKEQLKVTIMGGTTKYHIVQRSDSSLYLKSQRIQIPPISKEDEKLLAEHYFTLVKSF